MVFGALDNKAYNFIAYQFVIILNDVEVFNHKEKKCSDIVITFILASNVEWNFEM